MGQNFLKSEPALRMMCEAGAVSSKDTILEIGPGKGALTSKLLEKGATVIAIEKDRDLIHLLEEKFIEEIKNKKLILKNKDILSFDPTECNLNSHSYKIIANIPYNITGAIIKRFLSEVTQPRTMILLVQKEVAERIVARDNKESILSLSVKAYGEVKYMMKVGKRFFSPSPKVDSAIIAITSISKANFSTAEEESIFFTLIKTAFAHKRKVLKRNIETIVTKEGVTALFSTLSLNEKIRPEDVPFTTWIDINRFLTKNHLYI